MNERPSIYMLMHVSKECESVVLDDETEWFVDPGDTHTIATWLPTSTVTAKLVDPASEWPYELTNSGAGTSARAMKAPEKH